MSDSGWKATAVTGIAATGAVAAIGTGIGGLFLIGAGAAVCVAFVW